MKELLQEALSALRSCGLGDPAIAQLEERLEAAIATSEPLRVPQTGSLWRHKESNLLYTVESVANLMTGKPDRYPITIIYRRMMDGTLWADALESWQPRFEPRFEPRFDLAVLS